MKISIQRIGSHDLPLPKQETEGAAGFDLRSREYCWRLEPGERCMIPTGFAWGIPDNHCGQLWARSGAAKKAGIRAIGFADEEGVMAGLLDSDYRGEVNVILRNDGQETFNIEQGDRIAQLVIVPYIKGQTVEVESLAESERGAGGFGSTGER